MASPSGFPHHLTARKPRHNNRVCTRDSFSHKIMFQQQLPLQEALAPHPNLMPWNQTLPQAGFHQPPSPSKGRRNILCCHTELSLAADVVCLQVIAIPVTGCHTLKLISPTKICSIGNENEQQPYHHKHKRVASRAATTFVIKTVFPTLSFPPYNNLVIVPSFQAN